MKLSKSIIAVLVMCVPAVVCAADWPNWRGTNYDGISTETDWNPEALKTPVIAWKAQIGTGFSAVTIADGKAYAMGNVDKKTDIIYCFDALTGKPLWQHEYSEPLSPKFYAGGPSATPTVHDQKVYTLSKKGLAYCLNAETGDVIWEKNLSFKLPGWGFSGSVLIVENLAIYNVGAAGVALNKMTGEIVWKSADDAAGYASPVPYRQGEETRICLVAKDTVMGLEPLTGKVLWSYPWKTKYDVNAADPIISGNEIFVTSGYNHGATVIRITDSGPEKVWENKNMRSQMSGPVLIDGHLYGIDQNQLACVRWKTGEQLWAEKWPQNGSVSAAGDKLIVLGEKGKLAIVQATPQGYQEISSAQILEHKCWTMPTLANGRIYVRDAKKGALNNLVCIDVKKKMTASQ